MKREKGYYWVKRYRMWLIAEWVEGMDYDRWHIIHLNYKFKDSDFEEIDENRIIRNDNNSNAGME